MDSSPRRLARAAGLLYLVNILLGAFGIGVVPAMLVVSGDPAATAHNIQAHEVLYRLGLTAQVAECATNIPLAVIFYDLFKVVNRRLALLVVFFTLVGTAVAAAGLITQFAPTLASLSGDVSTTTYSVTEVFFGFYALCLGYLVLRSTFLPGFIGVLLAIDGVAYLVYSFADLVAPGFAAHLVPWIQLPVLPSEGLLCVWLLVAGVNVERWWGRARTAVKESPTPMEVPA